MSTLADPDLYIRATSRLYSSDMVKRVIQGIQDFRLNMADRIGAAEKGEDTIIQKRGRIVAALISIDDYRILRKAKGDPTDL